MGPVQVLYYFFYAVSYKAEPFDCAIVIFSIQRVKGLMMSLRTWFIIVFHRLGAPGESGIGGAWSWKTPELLIKLVSLSDQERSRKVNSSFEIFFSWWNSSTHLILLQILDDKQTSVNTAHSTSVMHQSFETPGPPTSGLSGAFTFYASESKWGPRSPGEKWMVEMFQTVFKVF